MSKGIVSQKPFSHKRRKKSFKKMLNRSGISIPEFKINPKLKSILSWGLLFTILIGGGFLILIKLLFFQTSQTISQVKFSDDTEATYKNNYLFDFINNQAIGNNYYIFKSNKDKLLSKIKNGFTMKNLSGQNIEFKFPFVGDIEFQFEPKEETITSEPETLIIGIQLPLELPITAYQTTETTFPLKLSKAKEGLGGTLGIQLLYYEPKILVKLNDKQFAVWDENTYVELKEGMLLGIREPDEEPLFVIDTPMYLSGTENIDGFFFEISLPDFLQITSLAKETFPDMKRFVYLAGSTRIVIFTSDDKGLYFNFIKGLPIEEQWNTQVQKYNILKEKYHSFKDVRTIDLGALEDDKVIIKY